MKKKMQAKIGLRLKKSKKNSLQTVHTHTKRNKLKKGRRF